MAAAIPAIISGVQAVQSNKNAQVQNEIAQENLTIMKEGNRINAENTVSNYDKEILGLEGKLIDYDRDKRETASQIDSYDKWLANYSNQYAQEVRSKQAQTDALMASGKESYDNFLNAIGYSDAMAGATGRVGAGTSQAATTGMLDRKLVDYVGDDRRLDANGGLFGSQLTAANMEMDQLKVDLEFQRQEMAANRSLAFESLADYDSSIALTQQSIEKSKAARDSMQEWINNNFPNGNGGSGSNDGNTPEADTVKSFLDPLGLILRTGEVQAPEDVLKNIFDPLNLILKPGKQSAGNMVQNLFDPAGLFKGIRGLV